MFALMKEYISTFFLPVQFLRVVLGDYALYFNKNKITIVSIDETTRLFSFE